MRAFLSRAMMRWMASMPPMPGIARSITTTCGASSL